MQSQRCSNASTRATFVAQMCLALKQASKVRSGMFGALFRVVLKQVIRELFPSSSVEIGVFRYKIYEIMCSHVGIPHSRKDPCVESNDSRLVDLNSVAEAIFIPSIKIHDMIQLCLDGVIESPLSMMTLFNRLRLWSFWEDRTDEMARIMLTKFRDMVQEKTFLIGNYSRDSFKFELYCRVACHFWPEKGLSFNHPPFAFDVTRPNGETAMTIPRFTKAAEEELGLQAILLFLELDRLPRQPDAQ
ncbi:uncharacterized protein JN550_005300 [Neoarthrinium moseri]|uniref:uncharacterized protein n=1 Tax=Neoarthrinium moseri TaxID=1658444 RepID=UPI001FDDDC0E|nr:uncharacterized protein JN550_005300 [Neoarthrinium moseri]KAI1870372.1 hypothetical protein JN550_005300 [Neoarthrinium moseri]